MYQFENQVFKVVFHCTEAFRVKHKPLSLLYIHTYLESNHVLALVTVSFIGKALVEKEDRFS